MKKKLQWPLVRKILNKILLLFLDAFAYLNDLSNENNFRLGRRKTRKECSSYFRSANYGFRYSTKCCVLEEEQTVAFAL